MRTRFASTSLALAAMLLALAACMAENPAGGSGGEKAAAAKDRMTLVYYNIPG